MLNIFSCVFWPSVCHLWRHIYVYLGLLPIFFIGLCFFFFFFFELYELFVYFGNESLVSSIISNYFLPLCRLSFCFAYSSLFCAKAFKFNYYYVPENVFLNSYLLCLPCLNFRTFFFQIKRIPINFYFKPIKLFGKN